MNPCISNLYIHLTPIQSRELGCAVQVVQLHSQALDTPPTLHNCLYHSLGSRSCLSSMELSTYVPTLV
jgi:hypothetical protein